MFAGWLRVSFGIVDPSLAESSPEMPSWAWSSLELDESPSTGYKVSDTNLGSASGASVSNKILSEGTCRAYKLGVKNIDKNPINLYQTPEPKIHHFQHLLCLARFHGHEKSWERKVGTKLGKFRNHLSRTQVGMKNNTSGKRPYTPTIRTNTSQEFSLTAMQKD